MALPPRKRRKPGASPAPGFTPSDDEPEAAPAPVPERQVAEEYEPEPQPMVPAPRRTAANHFLEHAGAAVARSPEDIMADEWRPGDQDWIPTPVLVRMQAFAGHYLTCMNGAEAARRAGYAEKHAAKQAAMLLCHPKVCGFIREQHASLLAKISTTQERVWAEITRIAFLDPGQLFGDDGELKKMQDIPEDVRRAISGYKITTKVFGDDGESVEKEIKFSNKDAALEKLLRLTGMFKEEKTTADDVADAMIAALTRARQRVIDGVPDGDA